MLYSTDGTKPLLGALCLAVALTSLAGCSMGPLQLTGPAATGSVKLSLSGTVHGGQQPVSDATIQLYAVGSGSYGAPATKLISSTVTTGTSGNFSIDNDYSCPSGSSLVYILATGGNSGSGTNASIALAAPLGACSTLSSSTTIQINELTTVATAYALGQYFAVTGGSTDSFGAPSTPQGQLGIANAFATANTLVNTSTGLTVQSSTLTGAGTTVTVTPEYLKLQTVADILASCVNSSGINDAGKACSTLFADVAPSGSTAPSDTLQAAVDMSITPTSNGNVSTLYGLATANPPYTALPTTAPPTDWTLGIQYSDPVSLAYPQGIAVDAAGNIWVLNNDSGASGSVTELSPTGSPIANVSTIGGVPLAAATPKNIAVDATPFTSAGSYNPNVWVTSTSSIGSGSGYVFEYGDAGSVSGAFSTSKSGYGLAIDASNDVFVYNESASSHVQIFEFPTGTVLNSTSSIATTTNIDFPTVSTTPGTADANGSTAFQAEYMAFDTAGNLWTDSGNSTSTDENNLVELSNINTTACAGVSDACWGTQSQGGSSTPWSGTTPSAPTFGTSTMQNTYTFTSSNLTSDVLTPYGIIAAQGGGVWIANATSGSNNLGLITSTSAGTTYGSSTSLDSPHFLAMDGAGNIWVTNKNGAITGGSTGGSISEFNSAGTPLSPTSSNTATTNPGFIHAGLDQAYGIGIDPSGNVWVADQASNTTVEEIVGAATPVVTPLALQLQSSSFPGKP